MLRISKFPRMQRQNNFKAFDVESRHHHLVRFARKPVTLKSTSDKVPEVPEIPGLSYILTDSRHYWRRRVWMLIMLVSCFVMVLNLGLRIQDFTMNEPLVSTSSAMNSTLEYPAIVICPVLFAHNPFLEVLSRNRLKMDDNVGSKTSTSGKDLLGQIENVYRLLDFPDITVFSLWNESDRYFDIYKYVIVKSFSIIDEFHVIDKALKLMTALTGEGKCTVLYSNTSLAYVNVMANVIIRLNTSYVGEGIFDGFAIRVHPLQEITEPIFLLEHGSLIRFGTRTNLNFETIVYNHINRSNKRCDTSDVVIKCERTCMVNTFKRNSNITCRLPFMMSGLDFTVCKSPAEFRRTYKASAAIIENFDLARCGCPIKCREVKYQIRFMNTQLWTNRNDSLIMLKFDYMVTTFTEYWLLSFSGLLSEIGGNLGLFMGVCVINLAQLIEYLFLTFARTFSGKLSYVH